MKSRSATSASGSAALTNIYAATGVNALSPVAARARPLVYVPNAKGGSVTVIDPATYTVLRTFKTGHVPQHVVPSYDVTRLWVANNSSNSLTPIDPVTGADGPPVKVDDPYNLYFTPDGKYALVVAEKLHRLDFRDPGDMQSRAVAEGGLPRDRSHGVHVGRQVRHRDVRVLGAAREDRSRPA